MTTILVIEGDIDLSKAFCDSLMAYGYTTLRVATGQVGVELARERYPQLIVCDIGLPDMDGYGVLENLRSHPSTASIPVIMLADQEDRGSFRRSMEQGADDYLTKPINLDSLLQAIHTQLTKREQLRTWLMAQSTTTIGMASISQKHLEQTFQALKQSPWSNLWVIQLCNHGLVQKSYGHVFGQLFLQTFGEQLHHWRETWNNPSISMEMLVRWGTDEFIVLWKGLKPPSKKVVDSLLRDLKTTLKKPLTINNHQLFPEISIDTISAAEIAMGSTLKAVLVKSPSAVYKSSSAEQLRRAIRRDELELYFQPQVDLYSGQIVGAEALVRWVLPGQSPMLPVDFIPMAEENGLMLSLGEWILEAALRQLSHWQTNQLSGISLAVNLSSYQLRSDQFIGRLMTMVNEAKVSPIMMDLELPERLVIEDLSRAKGLLTELQRKGFSTAIDDFGCSSLSHLQYLPVNILKLDKCFVRDLYQNKSNQIIVKAIMEMARGLNISTIAIGVETAKELSVLKQLKCQSMQGYLFSPALPAKDFETLLLESLKKHPQAVVKTFAKVTS